MIDRTLVAISYDARPRRARRLACAQPSCVGGPAEEVLAEHGLLALVVGADVLAVEHVGLLGHALEGELADGLAVLDHERDVARANLERRAAALRSRFREKPKPGSKKPA